MMRTPLILFFIFIIICSNLNAQFGVRIKYNNNNYKNWENAINSRFNENKKLLPTGYELGVDYWFRLKNRRVEFMPEISYAIARTNYINPVINAIDVTAVSFNFHTQLYALDMEGDCNCPTFSKQGPDINKGLFIHLTPGIVYHQASVTMNPVSSLALYQQVNKDISFRIGAGVGIDFGVSDFLTITPIISYYFYTAMTWDKLAAINNGTVLNDSSANMSQLQFTLRLGFRPDYGKRKFR